MKRPKMRRAARVLGVIFIATIAVLAAVGIYCRQDKTDVFLEVRGTYAGYDVVRAWNTDQSMVRLIRLNNHRGEAVTTAFVRRPLQLHSTYYIILTYAGAKTGEKILTLIPERPDLVLLAVQYPYTSPKSLPAYVRLGYDMRRAGFRSVAGGMLAVSFLEQEERLDPERLTVVGSSVGSIFATIHGGLDQRVPILLVIHGGGNLPALISRNVKQRWLAAPARLAAEIVAYSFDPIHFAPRVSPRKFVMISSRNDPYFPTESAQALYDSANDPKQIFWTRTEHVRSKPSDLVDEIVHQIELYLNHHYRD